MEKLEVLNILTDWNFWKKEIDTGITREMLLKQITSLYKTKEIVVITGIRRSGKSTLLLQFCKELIKSGINKEDILIVNFEDPRFKNFDLDMLNKIYEIYLSEINLSKEHYVILDEVQSITGWEKFARYLYENKRINVFVTGSSSKLLSSEYSTTLSGRHIDIRIKPLSFNEYIQFLGIDVQSNLDISTKRHTLKRAFLEYLNWGGFPKIALVQTEQEKRAILDSYFRDIIIKDILVRYKLKEMNKIEDLTKYYLTNISTLQSFNKIRNMLKLNLDTVERFSSYLSSVYLLSFVKKFSYSTKEQILNPKKIYCADCGIRNSVAFLFSKDIGRLAENIVFNELDKPENELFYWKGKHEADFIVKKGKKIVEVIQVCWNIENKDTKEREINGLLEACKFFKLKKGIILTEDYTHEENIDNIKVHYIPLWIYLLKKG